MFSGPFVLVDEANTGRGTAATIQEAWRLLAEQPQLVTVAGTLVPGWWGIDIDPADTCAEPEAGKAVAADLAQWSADLGLSFLLRASGRPGGHHIIVRLPEDLLGELYQLARRSAKYHGVSVTVRRTLRLLSAPHRLGLPCPVLDSTVSLSDFPVVDQGEPPASMSKSHTHRRQHRRKRRRSGATGGSRSESEYGSACARVRAGWSAARAWQAANQPGSKAYEQGEVNYRRSVWFKAVTTVVAEQGLDEAEAWQRARLASPARCRELGQDAWRRQYWEPALIEAQTDRPRRLRTGSTDAAEQAKFEAEAAEVEIIRAGLRAAAEHQLAPQGRRPQFRHSMAAALDALAVAIVHREGSIDTRTWAEQARLDRKTLLRVRKVALADGIIYRTSKYAGGSKSCDKYDIGPAAQRFIDTARETSTTKVYTPLPPTYGAANTPRMHQRHTAERRVWSLRCALSAITDATGETYANCQHPVAKVLRSLYAQRHWWQSLTPEQQETRRQARRAVLRAMSHSERRDWFQWLARRELIVAAADRTVNGTAVQGDRAVLDRAPLTLHRGLLDPRWREGATLIATLPVAFQSQLSFAAAA